MTYIPFVAVIYLPAIATILNILFLRHMLYEKDKITGAMLEVRTELRTAAQQSNRRFREVSAAIQELRADVQYNQDSVTGRLNKTDR